MPAKEDQLYIDFASKISFFEYDGVEEFEEASIDVTKFSREIAILGAKKNWQLHDLVDYLRKYPRSFWVLEALLQLRKFTNAQLIHFAFDVKLLNSDSIGRMYEYALSNVQDDPYIRNRFYKELGEKVDTSLLHNIEKYPKSRIVALFKMTISSYINAISNKQTESDEMLQTRLASSEAFAERLAEYLLEKRKLNDFLGSVNTKEFLRTKRVPVDTKGLHGESARMKLLKVLEGDGFKETDSMDFNQTTLLGTKMFATERSVDGIRTTKDNKLKRFDVVTILDGKPKHLIEVNFYTTIGTKIAINEDEYTDLSKTIRSKTPYKFIWVTDGNYWLTKTGQGMFKRLVNAFDGVYNINSFKANLSSLL